VTFVKWFPFDANAWIAFVSVGDPRTSSLHARSNPRFCLDCNGVASNGNLRLDEVCPSRTSRSQSWYLWGTCHKLDTSCQELQLDLQRRLENPTTTPRNLPRSSLVRSQGFHGSAVIQYNPQLVCRISNPVIGDDSEEG